MSQLDIYIEKLDGHVFNKEQAEADLREILADDYYLLTNNQLRKLSINARILNADATILLADIIQHNTYLQSLILNQIVINKIYIKVLFTAIANNKSIHSLTLKFIKSDNYTYPRAIGKILKNNKTISKLTLDDNYELEGIDKIMIGLIKNTSIKSLYMPAIYLNDESAYLISRMLRLNKTIIKLNIADNYINDIGMQHISNSLKNLPTVKDELSNYNNDMIKWPVNSTLKSLNISNLEGTNFDINTINSFLTKESLTSLNINNNIINFGDNYLQNNGPCNIKKLSMDNTSELYEGNNYMEDITKAFEYMPYLNNIKLQYNNLGLPDIKKLSEVLPMTVEKLNLSYNIIDESTLKYIAHILQNFNIIKFSMDNGNIDDDNILNDSNNVIAQVLHNNDKLKWLSIATNDINEQSMDAIAQALRSNTTLEYLNISSNDLTKNNINNIINMLYDNRTLRNINLSLNHMHNDERKNIAKLLLVNDSLYTLHISERTPNVTGSIYDLGMLYILTALRKNKTLKSLYISKPSNHIFKYVNSIFEDVSFENISTNDISDISDDEIVNFMNSVKGTNTTLEQFKIRRYFNMIKVKPYLERNIKNRVLKNSRLETIMYNRISDDDKQFLSYYIHDKNKNK